MAAPMLLASAMPMSVTVPTVTMAHRARGLKLTSAEISAAPAPVTVHWAVGVRWEPYSRGKRY